MEDLRVTNDVRKRAYPQVRVSTITESGDRRFALRGGRFGAGRQGLGSANRLEIAVPAGGNEHAFHLIAAHWASQEVVSAQVQYFRPKLLIGGAGSDDELRRAGEAAQVLECVLPGPFRQVGSGDYHVHPVLLEASQGIPPRTGLEQPPAGFAKHVVHHQAIVTKIPYQQRGNSIFANRTSLRHTNLLLLTYWE